MSDIFPVDVFKNLYQTSHLWCDSFLSEGWLKVLKPTEPVLHLVMQADELEGLNAEAELSGVAPWMRDDRWVHVASKRVPRERRRESLCSKRGCAVALARDCGLPVLDDGVGGGVVWDVVWGGAAGLYKELGVVDRGGGLNLQVDPGPDLIVQRVRAGILHGLELTVGVELEAVGEGAEAFLHHRDVVSVNGEGLGHVLVFGVLAGELDLQQVLPGDHIFQIVDCGDFILEVQVLCVLLQRKRIQNQPPPPPAVIKATRR